jgi:hypothetical protein
MHSGQVETPNSDENSRVNSFVETLEHNLPARNPTQTESNSGGGSIVARMTGLTSVGKKTIYLLGIN